MVIQVESETTRPLLAILVQLTLVHVVMGHWHKGVSLSQALLRGRRTFVFNVVAHVLGEEVIVQILLSSL
jgi:hypothetical protein